MLKCGRAISVVLCLILATLHAPAVAAQETINLGSISGRLTDSQDAVVVGATVTARQVDTNVTTTTVSDKDGRFRFPYLRLGPYEVIASVTGFADSRRSLVLGAGAAFELPMTLSIATVQSSVTVSGEVTVIEAARSQISGTVSQAEVKALPMNGRNVLDLALLIPGASPTNVGGGTQLFPETSAVPGVGISIGSQRNLSNNFLVDGLSANDDAAGLSGISYGVDAVDQFQVVTSGGQAELGRALGGYVSVVTRSGTNRFVGDTYLYARDDRFNAANALSGATLPMSQRQFGASWGGPVVRNRTFFFANVEQKRLDQTGLVTVTPENVAAINTRLSAVGYQGPAISTGIYPNPINTSNLLGKLDHQVGRADHLSVRYSLYTVDASNVRSAGALSAATAAAGIDNLDQTIAVSNVASLSSRIVNETRAQVAFSRLDAPPSDPIGPAVSISGIAAFGTASGSPTKRTTTMVQVVDNVSYQAGAHAVRGGVDLLFNDTTITYPRSVRGSYSFSSLANFLTGTYSNSGFAQTFGDSVVSQTNPNVGVYVQDEWKVGGRLTLNVGLRYDLQFLQTIETDTNNLSPRAGFAWLPFDGRRTVLRASAGRFFDRVPLRALANALLSAGNTTDLANLRQIGVSLSPAQAGAPVFPNILSDVVASTALPNLTTMDRRMQNAYSDQGSIEVEQQVGASSAITIGYQHLRGRQLIMSINQNVPSCVAAGNNNGCRPIATYANNSQYSSAGSSVYDAMLISFVQRPARWGSYRVSYTLSKSMNNVGEAFFNGPIDPFDLSKDWGRSDDDQRHRLVVSGALNTSMADAATVWQRLRRGFQLSGAVQAYSALPFNITSGVNTIQGTAGRPIVDGAFITRNAGQSDPVLTVSARLSRTFALSGQNRLEVLVEGFNLLNRANTLAVNANFGAGAYPSSPSSTFRQVTAVGEPRSAQLGVRLGF